MRPANAMTRRAGEDHLVAHERLEPHGPMAPGSADDAELELPVGDALDHGLRVVHLERDANAGMVPLELAEEERDDDRRRPGGRADRELPASSPSLSASISPSSCSSSWSMRCAPRYSRRPASVGSTRRPERSTQLGAEPLLERAHLQRHGGLRDPEPLRRLREAPQLDDRAEGCQLACIHKRILSVADWLAPDAPCLPSPGA